MTTVRGVAAAEAGPGQPAAGADEAGKQALLRNDAYVRGFVEALGMCPYAKRCRESGKLHRAVLLCEGGAEGSGGFAEAVRAAAAAVREVDALPADSVEVGLLIFPALGPSLSHGPAAARAFDQLVRALRETMEHDRAPGGEEPAFYCVAFHPDLPEDLGDEHRAVSFIRRSPDPTIQLVRRTLLDTIRGNQGSTYLDASKLSLAELMAVSAKVSLSDRIAAQNLETLRRAGADRARAQLAALRLR